MLNPSSSTNVRPFNLGEAESQNLAFGGHLQRFSANVNQLCDRVAQNQLSSEEAHGKIAALLDQLKRHYQETLNSLKPNEDSV